MVEELFEPEDAFSTTLGSESREEQKTLLCDQCRSLNLTVDKFIIEAGPSVIDISRYSQLYRPRKSKEQFQVKSGRNWEHFSTLKKLSEHRDTCQLCDLIYRAITRYGKNVNHATSCSLSWEVHGREPRKNGDGFVNKNRRIKLSWNEISGNRQEVYLMLVAPHDPLRPNSDQSAKFRKDNHFLGRGFGDRKEKQALMKSWIDLCVKDHELCRDNHGSDRAFQDLIKQSYFGVIDVADMQLKSLPCKEGGLPEPYVALSYVWGGQKAQDDPVYTTSRRTVMTHILHGGLETAWEKLPRTIQDAFLIVSRLGYRYLWIDSLCIVQDSKSSWQLNASAMHLVYGNAEFTICAADGEDSSVGLRAAKPVLRTMRPVESAREAMASVSDPEILDEFDSQPMNAECGPGIRLMVSRPLEAVVSDSVWSKRAWTFQERILSRRCLIFAEGRVYWQCRAIGISQDIYTDGSSKGLSLDPITSPLRTLQELQSRPLWSYMSYVSMYTGRLLTKERDALAAFRGVSWLLERYMDTTFLFGLPASHFDLALLWGLSEASSRRKPGHGSQIGQQTCTVDDLGNCTCRAEQDSFGTEEFPTWAWAGWMGGQMEYQPAMLEGCSENVQEWLVSHTWIQWHIRDEKGHLQPLWDVISGGSNHASNQTPRSKEDALWGGYPMLSTPNTQSRTSRAGYAFPRVPRKHSEHNRTSRSANLPNVHFVVSDDSDFSEAPLPMPPPPSSRHRPRSSGRHPRDNTLDRQRKSEVENSRTGVSVVVDVSQRHRNDHERKRNPRDQEHEREHEYELDEHELDEHELDEHELDEHEHTTNERYGDNHSYHATVNKNSRDRPRFYHRHTRDNIPSRPNDSQDESDNSSAGYINQRRNNALHVDSPYDVADPALMQPEQNGSRHSGLDQYGRLIPDRIPQKDTRLDAILPDSPFGVIRRKLGRKKKPSESLQFMPILQFCTWRSELYVMARNPGRVSATKTLGAGLRWSDIVDSQGDWCGSIVLDEKCVSKRQGHMCTFIALSEAKRFNMDECPVWTYYIPKEREESEWDLYYVLLLERNEEHGLWERVGLGKVFQAAFRENIWAEIKLG